MNKYVKYSLYGGGGLLALYVLYSMYENYLANQSATAQANADALQFMPPLEAGGYAPAQTTAGNVTTGGADNSSAIISDLEQSLGLIPSTTTDGSSSTGITYNSPGSGVPSTGASYDGQPPLAPVGVTGSGTSSSFGQSPTIGKRFGGLVGVGTRLQLAPDSGTVINSSDGSNNSIV